MTNHEAIPQPAAITRAPRAGGWLLVLDPPASVASMNAAGAPEADSPPGESRTEQGTPWFGHRLLGVSVVLRLALTAQSAGAHGVVLPPGSVREPVQRALADDRLKIAIYESDDASLGDTPLPSIRVPANLVVHRAALGAIAAQWDRSSQRGAMPEPRATPPREIVFEPGMSEASDVWQMALAATGPYGFSPIAIDDRASFEAAERALLRSLRKPQDGWTSTHLNRPVSLAITRRLVATSLRPNQVSVAILGVGLLGAFLASRGTYASLVAGAALFHTQSVLDGCDGEMSRLTFRGSHTGEWLDTVGDDLTNYGFFGGAAYGLYTQTGQTLYLWLGGLTVFCGLVGSGLEYRYLIKIGSGDLLKYPLGIGKAPGAEPHPGAKPPLAKVADAIAPLFKRDTFVFLTFLGAVVGATGPLLAVFSVGALGVLIAVLKAEVRMARQRAAREGRGARPGEELTP